MIRLFYFISICCVCMLSGCADDAPAPVIDAWYQKGAASNFYIVQRDETIYSIAFAFGLDYRDLVAVNHLSPPYRIQPGQRLIMTHRPPRQHVGVNKSVPAQQAAVPTPVIAHLSAPNWHWPTRGRVIETFSTRPDGHPAISIGGRLGQPVRAAASGIVVYSGDGIRGYGNLIIVKHNDSYLSAYGFNLQNLVVVGNRVHAGQLIARMGKNDAGRVLLYFEIRHDGTPVNPMRYLH